VGEVSERGVERIRGELEADFAAEEVAFEDMVEDSGVDEYGSAPLGERR